MEGLGFAIPINDVMSMLEDIMTNGYVTNKAYLGVTAATMNAQMAQQTGLTERRLCLLCGGGQCRRQGGHPAR